uniref:Uncharacterized protein n=1 Tax=Romanomermis culicivorax TaxID=13658 RepID=A0A915IDU0_ROMCU
MKSFSNKQGNIDLEHLEIYIFKLNQLCEAVAKVDVYATTVIDRYLGTNFINGPTATKFIANIEENVNKIVTDELLKPHTVSDDNRLAVEHEVITLVELLSNLMCHRLITDNSKLLKAFHIFVPPKESSETLLAEAPY